MGQGKKVAQKRNYAMSRDWCNHVKHRSKQMDIVKWFARVAVILIVAHSVGFAFRSSGTSEYMISKSDRIQENIGFWDGIQGTGKMTAMKRNTMKVGVGKGAADFLDVTNPGMGEVVLVVGMIMGFIFWDKRRNQMTASTETNQRLPEWVCICGTHNPLDKNKEFQICSKCQGIEILF
jgi:hypothetical protein